MIVLVIDVHGIIPVERECQSPAYQSVDAGISFTYQSASLEDNQLALGQALSIISASAPLQASREDLVAAASKGQSGAEPFEKEGYLWVGRVGLKFNEANQLIEVVPGF